MTLKEMVEMELNSIQFRLGDVGTIIRRVPGGWLYTDQNKEFCASAFVPLPATVEPVKDVDY